MARMEVNYTVYVENKAGVEDTRHIKMFVPFMFSDTPEQVFGNVVDVMKETVKKMKCELMGGLIVAYFDGLEVFTAEFYSNEEIGEINWIRSSSETMH
jgi:hypothetical protein